MIEPLTQILMHININKSRPQTDDFLYSRSLIEKRTNLEPEAVEQIPYCKPRCKSLSRKVGSPEKLQLHPYRYKYLPAPRTQK